MQFNKQKSFNFFSVLNSQHFKKLNPKKFPSQTLIKSDKKERKANRQTRDKLDDFFLWKIVKYLTQENACRIIK